MMGSPQRGINERGRTLMWIFAVHEAGHAVAGVRAGFTVSEMRAERAAKREDRRTWDTAACVITRGGPRDGRARAILALGGLAAETLFGLALHDPNLRPSSDVREAARALGPGVSLAESLAKVVQLLEVDRATIAAIASAFYRRGHLAGPAVHAMIGVG